MSERIRDNLDEYLSAYLDDQLDDDNRARVDRLLAEDPDVRRRLDELRRTVSLLRSMPKRAAPSTLIEDITTQAERDLLLGDDVPVRPARGSRRTLISLLASAALVAILVGGGLWIFLERGQTDPLGHEQVAKSDLNENLEAPTDRGPSRRAEGRNATGLPPEERDTPAAEHARPGRGRSADDRKPSAIGPLASAREGPARVRSAPKPGTAKRHEHRQSIPAQEEELAVSETVNADEQAQREQEGDVVASPVTNAVPDRLGTYGLGSLKADAQRGTAVTRADADESSGDPGERPGPTFAEKLAAGTSFVPLVQHPFAAESSVVIDVHLPDGAAREAALDRLRDFLDARAVPEVREYAFLRLIGFDVDLNERSEVFLWGRQGVNYPEDGGPQVLARLAPEQLVPLVDTIAPDAAGETAIRAAVGPLEARGPDAVTRLFAFAAPKQRRAGGTEVHSSEQAESPAPTGARGRAMRRDAETLGAHFQPAGPGPTDTQPVAPDTQPAPPHDVMLYCVVSPDLARVARMQDKNPAATPLTLLIRFRAPEPEQRENAAPPTATQPAPKP